MADRKAELEKKRKKLDELRKARELKKAETKDKEVVYTFLQLLAAVDYHYLLSTALLVMYIWGSYIHRLGLLYQSLNWEGPKVSSCV